MRSKLALMANAPPYLQRGVVTMFIAMVMLILITIMVIAAYSLSTTNLRIVGNVQVREEATAAANLIIERTLQSPFYEKVPPEAELLQPVDINGDGIANPEYLVDLVAPVCVRATPAGSTLSSSVDLPGLTTTEGFNTIWELDATATEIATGAKVRVIQAVRVLMSDADKVTLCDV
jgi:hypothetical protein